MKTITIINQSAGTEIGHCIGCADKSLTRLVGLLGRTGLDTGGGLLIQPSSGIHTMGMKFTIDAVGLDADMRVVKLWPGMRPNRVSTVHLKVRSVLELADGQIEECRIEVGHVLEVIANDTWCSQKAPKVAAPFFPAMFGMGGMSGAWAG